MGVLDGVVIVEGLGAVLGLNFGRPLVTNGDFATWIFPNYFGQCLSVCSHNRLYGCGLTT